MAGLRRLGLRRANGRVPTVPGTITPRGPADDRGKRRSRRQKVAKRRRERDREREEGKKINKNSGPARPATCARYVYASDCVTYGKRVRAVPLN